MKPAPISTADWLRYGQVFLDQSTSPRLDAEVLLAHCSARSRSWLLGHQTERVSAPVARRFRNALTKRARRVPVAYLTKRREFFSHDFFVDERVLVPRPESERLVEQALKALQPGDTLVDVGTGSGCLGISIALASPDTPCILLDVSRAALNVARLNIRLHRIRNVRLIQADCWPKRSPAEASSTVVVANLPYLNDAVWRTNPDLQTEPTEALRAGRDGLLVIRKFLRRLTRQHYYPKMLLLEINPEQRSAIKELAWGKVHFLPAGAKPPGLAALSPPSAR